MNKLSFLKLDTTYYITRIGLINKLIHNFNTKPNKLRFVKWFISIRCFQSLVLIILSTSKKAIENRWLFMKETRLQYSNQACGPLVSLIK